MRENLKKFLVDLASNTDRMSRFVADPTGELDAAGLSADEKTALLARDGARLRRVLGASPVDHMTRVCKKGSNRKAMAGDRQKGVQNRSDPS